MFGLFGNKIPEAPSIENESQYIEWYVRYDEKLAYLRNLNQFKGFTNEFVAAATKQALTMLKEYPTKELLYNRVQELVKFQIEKGEPLMKEFGSMNNLDREARAKMVTCLLNITIGTEILKKKYNYK
ncbi:hypothetical protein [Candidatus Methylomicrobium oryzae]|uniref:hypothetical protein n=1 Tax=Candidatus Methylomicrobium oryzae TaxID=2802053 RepID=UPI001920881E|nr:hypothetical protein [Methylomicrobium sp. RS1]MBL1264925.1 hypothetical protein [Methylomicrobium sp. RS1]